MMEIKKLIKNFFIPSLQNQLRPYSLRFATLAFVVALSIAIEIAFYAYVNVAFKKNDLLGNIVTSIQTTVAEALPQVIFEQTNIERTKVGEKPFSYNSLLALAAKMKAEDMSKNGYFAHQSPDGSMPWDFMERVKYNYSYAGENLAVNFFDANDVVNAWMKSPSHRTNILNRDYQEIGIAAVRGMYDGRDTVFVVQMFGTPGVDEPIKNYATATATPKIVKATKKATSTMAIKIAGTTTVATSGPISIVMATSVPLSINKAAKLSLSQKYMVSPRHLARDAYIVLLSYMFLALVIPMYMIYHNHASADRGLRFREIFILFRQPITSALITLVCVSLVMGLNYYWSKRGTNIYQAAIGRQENILK